MGPPVGLNGSLEEFSLQDILQILALGQKSGQLSLDTPAGVGTIVFRDGRVVAAFDDGAPPLETSLASWPGSRRPEVLRRRIVASLAPRTSIRLKRACASILRPGPPSAFSHVVGSSRR